jgi:hypothetical protein
MLLNHLRHTLRLLNHLRHILRLLNHLRHILVLLNDVAHHTCPLLPISFPIINSHHFPYTSYQTCSSIWACSSVILPPTSAPSALMQTPELATPTRSSRDDEEVGAGLVGGVLPGACIQHHVTPATRLHHILTLLYTKPSS